MESEFENFKKENGIYLEDTLGVKEWAFSRENALKLLGIMKNKGIVCSGCDVIKKEDGKFVYDYGFFSYEQVKNRTNRQHVENSIYEAEKYINNYPEKKEIIITLLYRD